MFGRVLARDAKPYLDGLTMPRTSIRISSFRTAARQAARWMSTVGVIWLCSAAHVWAQANEEEEEPKGWVPSYMIVICAVSLALMMICRAGKREVSFRRD